MRVACYLLLLAAGAALLWHQAAGLPPYRAAGLLSWPVVAAASAAAELFVLHIQVRREAQAVSLSEIPMMLGLFFCTPLAFGLGRVAGVLLVCALWRRQAPIKLIFNCVQVGLESAVAFTVVLNVPSVTRAAVKLSR